MITARYFTSERLPNELTVPPQAGKRGNGDSRMSLMRFKKLQEFNKECSWRTRACEEPKSFWVPFYFQYNIIFIFPTRSGAGSLTLLTPLAPDCTIYVIWMIVMVPRTATVHPAH